MNTAGKWIIGVLGVIIVVLLAALVLVPGKKKNLNKEPIKIGAIFAMSGNSARYGEWGKNALDLAVDEVNKKGGIRGRPVTVVYEDDKGLPQPAISAYQKLRSVDKTDYIITFLSSVALAVEPLANKDDVVQMDTSATISEYSTPDDYSFRTGIIATQLAGYAAQSLYEDLRARRVALLTIANDSGKASRDVFKKEFKGTIVADETFPQDGSDFKTQLAKIKGSDPDYVFLVSFLKEGGTIVRQAADLQLDFKFFSTTYSVEGSDFLQIAGSASDGLLFVSPKFDITDPSVAHFAESYRQAYKEDPVVFAGQTYDGAQALFGAMEACQDVTPACVRDELYKLDFEGTTGPIKFDRNGDVQKPVELKVIKEGKFVPFSN